MKSIFQVLFLSIALSLQVQVQATVFTGAEEVTQLLNYGELYTQTDQSLSQLTTQISQLDNLRKQVMAGGAISNFASYKGLFSDVANTTKQAQGIGYNSQVMAGRFSSLYPDFNSRTGTNFFTQYGDWSKDLNSLLKAALGNANLHANNFANDAVTNQTLQDKVRSANTQESQVAVINAGNEVALATYQEMQQMRQMQVVQNAAQTSYLAQAAGQADKKVAQDHALDQMFSKQPEMRTYDQHLQLNK